MSEYKHKEAFCLMWYACSCGHTERIWNSRDGVTPFTLNCPSCGSMDFRHVHWELDHCQPKYQLKHWQKFWRDGTPEEAEKFTRNQITLMRQAGYGYAADIDVKQYVKDSQEFQAGWPMLDVYMG